MQDSKNRSGSGTILLLVEIMVYITIIIEEGKGGHLVSRFIQAISQVLIVRRDVGGL